MKPALLIAAATLLAGCAQTGPVRLPELPTAPAFKQGMPSDAAISPNWWTLYGDAELDDLQQHVGYELDLWSRVRERVVAGTAQPRRPRLISPRPG